MAGGGDQHEGLLQLVSACHCGQCGSIPNAALCSQGQTPVARDSLYGYLHTVKLISCDFTFIKLVLRNVSSNLKSSEFSYSNFLLHSFISKEILTIREAVWLTDNTYKYEDLVRMMGEIISALRGKIKVSDYKCYAELSQVVFVHSETFNDNCSKISLGNKLTCLHS